jgi:hypothetical protein
MSSQNIPLKAHSDSGIQLRSPSGKAECFCRSAPTVGFMASQFFFTGNLLWERAVS